MSVEQNFCVSVHFLGALRLFFKLAIIENSDKTRKRCNFNPNLDTNVGQNANGQGTKLGRFLPKTIPRSQENYLATRLSFVDIAQL